MFSGGVETQRQKKYDVVGGPSQQLVSVTSILTSGSPLQSFTGPFYVGSSPRTHYFTRNSRESIFDFDGKWLSNSPLCKTCLTSFIRTVLIQTFDYLSSLLRRILMGQLPGYQAVSKALRSWKVCGKRGHNGLVMYYTNSEYGKR